MEQQRLFRLMQALEDSDLDTAEALYQSGVRLDVPLIFDPDDGGIPGASRYRSAFWEEHEVSAATLLALCAVRDDKPSVGWLVERNAHVPQTMGDNRDAAWYALMAGHEEVHEFLLGWASPNLRASSGVRRSRLHDAVRMSSLSGVEAIIRRPGVKVNAADAAGQTPLHINYLKTPYLPSDAQIAGALLAAGASPNVEDMRGLPPHAYASSEATLETLAGMELRRTPEMARTLAAMAAEQVREAKERAAQEPARRPEVTGPAPRKNGPKQYKPQGGG